MVLNEEMTRLFQHMASANRMYKLSGLSPKNGSAWWGPAHRSPPSWPGLQDGCWEPGHSCCRGRGAQFTEQPAGVQSITPHLPEKSESREEGKADKQRDEKQ